MRLSFRSALPAAAALALAAPVAAQAPAQRAGELPLKHAPTPTRPEITAADAMTRLYILADDSMMGREAGTRGNVMGTDYIAREARRMGLQPAGENGTFFQTIPLVQHGPDPASQLTVDGATLKLGTDFLPIPTVEGVFAFGDRLTAANTPVVYGGRIGDPDVISPGAAAGKLVVFAAPAADGQGRSYRFWAAGGLERYRTAAGLAIATLDETPAPVLQFFTETQVEMRAPEQPGAATPQLMPGLVVTRAAAERLLGRPLAGAAVGTAGRPVTGTSGIRVGATAFPARNVVALLPGTDPALRGQMVAIGAHNDHVGMDRAGMDHDSLRAFNAVLRREGLESEAKPMTPEAAARIKTMTDELHARHGGLRRDTVFNGADDDGSGTTGVLEIAEYLAAHRPKRSVLFVWHTGEEKGLLGSTWFTEHPTVPRDSIVAQLNIDMIGRGAQGDLPGGGPGYLQLVGSRRLSTQLGDLVEQVNREGHHGFTFDYSMDANGHEANIYCRSDHYSYARWGIPVTFFTTGGHQDYHMLTDEPQYIDYAKLASVSSLIADIALHVANRPDRLVVDKPKPDPHGECRQ